VWNIPAAMLQPRSAAHDPFVFLGLSGAGLAIAGVYAAIALLFLLRLAAGYVRARRLVKSSRPIETNLRESDVLRVPIAIGFFQPRILLPSEWREWPPHKPRAVLAHERAHVRRGDWAVAVFARVNRAIYWFHPLAWWLERKINLLAEQACDDAAVIATGDARLATRRHYWRSQAP
jgi:beta-lactamase regulating signal transducer with metallopeptidase domain